MPPFAVTFIGDKARIEILDRWKEGWGHINVDQILFSDRLARPARNRALWADYGRDFYAAVSWSDVPKEDGRRIWLGWMSNWQYAQDIPTSPWRSGMTVARTLSLRKVGSGYRRYRLLQHPSEEIEKLRGAGQVAENVSLADAIVLLNKARSELLDIELTLPVAGGAIEILLIKPESGIAPILIDTDQGSLLFDRTQFGDVSFHEQFPGVHRSRLRAIDGKVTLRLLIDVASVEIFANDGESVISDLVFPKAGPWQFGFSYKGEVAPPEVDRIAVYPLRSAWR